MKEVLKRINKFVPDEEMPEIKAAIASYTAKQVLEAEQKADRKMRFLKLNWHSHKDYETGVLEARIEELLPLMSTRSDGRTSDTVIVNRVASRLNELEQARKALGESDEN